MAGAAALLLTAVVALGVGLVLLGQAGARTEEQRHRAEAQLRRGPASSATWPAAPWTTTSSRSVRTRLLKSPLPGLQPLRKQLLESALKYYQEFVRQGGDDPELQAELAQAYFRVGTITGGDRGPSRRPGRLPPGARLVPGTFRGPPGRLRRGGRLARTHRWIGRMQADRRQPESRERRSGGRSTWGGIGRRATPTSPLPADLAWSYNNLGSPCSTTGKRAAALPSFGQAITPGSASSASILGARVPGRPGPGLQQSRLCTHLRAGRLTEALAGIRKAVVLSEGVVNENTSRTPSGEQAGQWP